MKVYDFVLGSSLSKNYIRGRYLDRFEREESIQTLSEIIDIFTTSISKAFETAESVPFNVTAILEELALLNSEVSKGSIDPDNSNKFRLLLSLLAYEGFECYLIERVDLTTATQELQSVTRAYMIDKNDTLFPELSRVSTGYGIIINNPAEASLPDVIMTFLNNVLNFDQVTQDILELNIQLGKYAALKSANTGWEYNINDLSTFLDDYGYNFIIALT